MEEMIIDKQFRDQVAAYMESQGVSQAELARRLGVTPAMVSQYMSGHRTAGPDLMERISDALSLRPVLKLEPIPQKKKSLASA